MEKVFRLSFFVLLALMLCTACKSENEGNDTITEQSVNNYFSIVTDKNLATTTNFTGVGYQIRLNYTRATADIIISGLKLNGELVYPDIKLTGIPFKVSEDGWFVISATNLTPNSNGIMAGPIFDSFKMNLLQRIVDEYYMPAIYVEMTLNNRFNVISSSPRVFFFGPTTTVDESGTETVNKNSQYVYELSFDSNTLSITIPSASFIPSMPALNIAMKAVPFTMSETGIVTFEASSITPTIADVPYPNFPISNLKGDIDLKSSMKISFDCEPAKAPGIYHVSSVGSYLNNMIIE